MHCNLATGGPGAAMRHAPFGRPRHPLGTFPCGKVPRPPAGGRNLPQETGFLRRAMERSLLSFFCFAGGFASAEATRGLSDRPLETFGVHPLLKSENCHKKQVSCDRQGKEFYFLFSVSQGVSPLRRRPKGFPLALWKPSGENFSLAAKGGLQQRKEKFLVPQNAFFKKARSSSEPRAFP